MHSMRVHAGVAIEFGLGLLLAGCAPMPGATPVIGPDGTALLHVHCGDDQVACFQLAGEHCPSGYDLSPIFDPRDGNFLLRCRGFALDQLAVAPPPLPPAPQPPAPPARVSSNRPSVDDWPPIEVATPAEPWPAPATSARTPVEIGY